MFWLIKVLLGSLNFSASSEATVGLGANCRYQPDELTQALIENQLIYLTNEFTVSGLQIKQDKIHLIGGFDNCDDIHQRLQGKYKTKISGAYETVAVKINSSDVGEIMLENFEISEGYSHHAGGIQIIQASQFKLKDSLVHNNISETSGGGIQFSGDGVQVEIKHSKIFNNTAKTQGGGVAISGNYNLIEFQDSLVFSNSAGVAGGGLSCQNHNQINIQMHHELIDLWVAVNESPLADDIYFDLNCQLQIESNQSVGFKIVN